MKKTTTVGLGLLLTAAMTLSQPGLALEPHDNAAPWKWTYGYGNATLFVSKGAVGWGAEDISSSSDVDYLVMACTGGAPSRKIRYVSLNFSHARGDLELGVYDLAGNQLASSTGVSDSEFLDIGAFGAHVVVLKAYGYNGATGPYGVSLTCG